MKTLLALLQLVTGATTVVATKLPNNQYQNNIQRTTNKITTDWIKPESFNSREIIYNLPENATDIELADFELNVRGTIYLHTFIDATIKKDITWFSQAEKKQVGATFKKDKGIHFTTDSSILGVPTIWKLLVEFELPQFGWKLSEVSDGVMIDYEKPSSQIRTIDLKMKFSYTIPTVGVTHVIHFNQQVIEQVRFGSQAGANMPAQWDIDVWLPVQPRLLFRWMDYANSWEAFINNYPIIRLTSGNSNLRTYTITQWSQDTSAGTFLDVNTSAITDQPDQGVTIAHSTAAVVHGNQDVSIGIVMDIFRDAQNIFATFEMTSISTFTDADNCQPGASGSAFIGDIELE